MARTKGSKNKTAREIETQGRHLIEKARYMKKIEALKKKTDKKK